MRIGTCSDPDGLIGHIRELSGRDKKRMGSFIAFRGLGAPVSQLSGVQLVLPPPLSPSGLAGFSRARPYVSTSCWGWM